MASPILPSVSHAANDCTSREINEIELHISQPRWRSDRGITEHGHRCVPSTALGAGHDG
jgi:hypothetical protein